MRIYLGLFGRRRLRPYGGVWWPFLGGALGVNRRGRPWFKLSLGRLLRRMR